MKYLIYTLLITIACLPVHGQQAATREEVMRLVQKTKEVYARLNGVHINIGYYYANESAPGRLLDSMQGTIVMSGNDYRVNIQETETMVNSRYSVTLFKPDTLMYLAKPTSLQSYNPVASMDSLFTHFGGAQYTVKHEGGFAEIVLQYQAGQPCKSMLFRIEEATGYVVKTVMVLQTRFMAPEADEAALRAMGYDDYAVVESRLTDYRQENLPAGYFDEQQFFTRDKNEFHVTDRYRNYKIFVATPNL